MSSGSSYPRVAVELRASRRLLLYAVSLVALATIAPWLVGIPWLFALPVSLAVLPLSAPVFRWAQGMPGKIVWQADGRWVLVDKRTGTHEEAQLLPGIYIGARLLVLHWRCAQCGKRFRAALLPDNCEENALRRLVVRLRATPDAELFEHHA